MQVVGTKYQKWVRRAWYKWQLTAHQMRWLRIAALKRQEE